MTDNPLLFAGNSSLQLAEKIAKVPHTGIFLGDIYHHQFPSGEFYCQYKQNIRGADVFLLQSICKPANDNLMQLLVMADAARRASAGRITAILPLFGYQRQDRKDKPRVPISAKLVMGLLEQAGIQRFIVMDLHSQQQQGFTDFPVDHLYFQPSLIKALAGLNIQTVVSPDEGGIKKGIAFSKKANCGFAFIVKDRKNDTDVEVTQFVGDVKGKSVLVLDDLTESAGTLIAAAEACRANGATKVYAAVTHGCFSITGDDKLNDALASGIIDKFFCSDIVKNHGAKVHIPVDSWQTVSVADTFAQAIHGVHMNESITELFS